MLFDNNHTRIDRLSVRAGSDQTTAEFLILLERASSVQVALPLASIRTNLIRAFIQFLGLKRSVVASRRLGCGLFGAAGAIVSY